MSDRNPQSGINAADQARLDFLAELDGSHYIVVTDWEAQFLGDLIQNPRPLTDAVRDTIDALQSKYRSRL